ncbi:MAG: hypothetical protein LIO93_03635 [Bacteroidales bacterium]|nr:hypothetical protein [Bacteroidales bacterium]
MQTSLIIKLRKMVNWKLINFLILLFLFGCKTNYTPSNNYPDIKDYLDLNIQISKDTVVFNEVIELTLLFKNKSDSSIYFYPEGRTTIEDNYIYSNNIYIAGDISTYEINPYVNIDNSVLLNPDEIYSLSYNIEIKKPYFYLGENQSVVIYGCSKQKRIGEIHPAICGQLISPPFRIFIKE